MEKNWPIQIGIFLTLLIMFISSCSTSTVMTKKQRESKQDAQDAELKVVLWADHENNTYKVGEDIYLFFTTNKDCFLTLININNDGSVRILLPNKFQKDNMAKAGYVYRIPSESAEFTFKAREPVGEETVKAIAILEDVSLYDERDVSSSGNFKDYVKSADFVKKTYDTLKNIEREKWTEYQLKIKTINGRP